jgi:hypothetical protein
LGITVKPDQKLGEMSTFQARFGIGMYLILTPVVGRLRKSEFGLPYVYGVGDSGM